MSAMLRWSPTRQFHFHQGSNEPLDKLHRPGTASAANQMTGSVSSLGFPPRKGGSRTASTSFSSPFLGVDPKDVNVSLDGERSHGQR